MKRERLEWRGEEAERCRTDCNNIAGTANPDLLLFSRSVLHPLVPLISPLSSLLPLRLLKLSLRLSFTPSELRFTRPNASCYLFLTHTHTHTVVTTAAGPPVSGPHEIFPGVRFPCFHGTGSTRLLSLCFTMETCNVTITLSFNPIGLTPYHLIKFSLMGEAVNIRIADVIMHSHSAFIARPTTDAIFLYPSLISFSSHSPQPGNRKGKLHQLNYMLVDRKACPGMYSQTSAASGIGVTLLPSLPPSSPLCCQTEAH